ncbi:endonuclease/exonuclease/phosphatase family protein [Massilibacteroides sp.]|uniref:endonuclease/exonuclease/phosphatase family protein n=1 Tax=Massilibacteroides sp. TaxID=2034766 RepID=UPI002619612E|nr:endonuclease/exonuclease/phosphatase family protein [Massilibacteroides sp.]MDD4515018.1 endonuclease/exonuclease/phosphatase family protein [Massilibacteroides sp.]
MKRIILSLFLCTALIVPGLSQTLNVASYNIRYENKGDTEQGNGWEQRCPVICQLITYNDFDIWGGQEVLNHQLNDLLENLNQYGYVGVGRDDGITKGEYAPIFYKKDKFSIIESGHFWLSEETTYPNKGWDAALPRICTWGHFKEISSGRAFWFFNLHMDHVGIVARRESAKLVLQRVKEICGDEPVILTGDFNVDQTNEIYEILAHSGTLADSYEKASIRYALNGTFNAFDTNLKTESRIDHIFVSPSFLVEKYGVLTDTYRSPKKNANTIVSSNFPKEVSLTEYIARTPSDHFPVRVELSFFK